MTLWSIAQADTRPSRRILAVVTVGRATCAGKQHSSSYLSAPYSDTNLAPILEICRILHERGHRIEFACLEGWQKLAKPHHFISKVHVVGRDLTEYEDAELYRLLDASGIRNSEQRSNMFKGFGIFGGWWAETYPKIKALCQAEQPDFIFADDLADACMDVARDLDIPLAGMAPQLPPSMLPVSYVPGMPGYQLKHITSENASLVDRVAEELCRLKISFAAGGVMGRITGRSASSGPPKPGHLFFVNSFFGLEVPKELPPMVRPVGPVLAETFPSFSPDSNIASFLDTHKRVVYIAFGTHIRTPDWRKQAIWQGLESAMNDGLLDGVVWALKNKSDHAQANDKSGFSMPEMSQAMEGGSPRWLIDEWCPQRAVLAHSAVCLFISHCGASSTAEAAYHGVPVLTLAGYGDQFGHALRLEAAGVAVRLDKDGFTAQDIETGASRILRDVDGTFSRNVLRLRRVAHANAQRKHLAAQMIEELLYDHELRFEYPPHGRECDDGSHEGPLGGRGRALRPCHLETCDMRMSWIKRTNLDLWILFPLYAPVLLLASWL